MTREERIAPVESTTEEILEKLRKSSLEYRPLKEFENKYICYSYGEMHYIKIVFSVVRNNEKKNIVIDHRVWECPFCEWTHDDL